MTLRIFLFFALFSCYLTINSQNISIGNRHSIPSEILNENRPFSVYLPPSYYNNPEQEYPVLYILDGDYNFQYVAGLIELQSNISENIPEMILVGISGKGTTTYRKNCKPFIEDLKDSGNADDVLNFIGNELIPYIDQQYKTADYNMLGGHSIGGVFVVNAALKKPDVFKHYIAISPALWWADHAMDGVATSIMEQQPNFSASIYTTLANEEGMGVKQFLKLVNDSFRFKEFPKENHNSVGVPSYTWALKDIFSSWRVDKLYFESVIELEAYHRNTSKKLGRSFTIPNGVLYNTVIYILKDNQQELEKIRAYLAEHYPQSVGYYNSLLTMNMIKKNEFTKAVQIAEKALKNNPNSFELNHKLAEAYFKSGKITEALEHIKQAINLGKAQHIRQWQMNELMETKELINH